MFISIPRIKEMYCTLYNLHVCAQTFLLPQQSIACDMYPKAIP